MKAGFYVWVDYQERKVRRSNKYEMVEEFDARYNDRPYPHRWNLEIFEFQILEEAIAAQQAIAKALAGDPAVNTMARNTSLFKTRGPVVGDF